MSWIQSDINQSVSSYVPPQWSTGKSAEIVEALEKHYAGEINLHDYWAVGDERVIHLSEMPEKEYPQGPDNNFTGKSKAHAEQDVTFVLLNKGGKILADGTTECAFVVGQKDVLWESDAPWLGSSNNYGTNYGWIYVGLRKWANDLYYHSIPLSIREIFKAHINHYPSLYNENYLEKQGVDTIDYFTLPDFIYSSLSYYNTSSNKLKYNPSSTLQAHDYWTPIHSYTTATYSAITKYYKYIDSSGETGEYYAGGGRGIAPQGVI